MLLPIPTDAENLPPAVAVADPSESLAVVQPMQVVGAHINPGVVGFGVNGRYRPIVHVAQPNHIFVLQPVELLHHHLLAAVGPGHVGHVLLARIAGQVKPRRRPTRRGHHTHAAGRIGCADFGVRQRRQFGIEAVGVVDEVEGFDAFGVELPVGDGTAVFAPPKSIPQMKLFLVHPVRRAVDDVSTAILGKLSDDPTEQFFHVDVLLVNVGDGTAVGRKFGKHQAGFGQIVAQLMQRAVG